MSQPIISDFKPILQPLNTRKTRNRLHLFSFYIFHGSVPDSYRDSVVKAAQNTHTFCAQTLRTPHQRDSIISFNLGVLIFIPNCYYCNYPIVSTINHGNLSDIKYPHFTTTISHATIFNPAIREYTQLQYSSMYCRLCFTRCLYAKFTAHILDFLCHTVECLSQPTITIGHTLRVFEQNLLLRQHIRLYPIP